MSFVSILFTWQFSPICQPHLGGKWPWSQLELCSPFPAWLFALFLLWSQIFSQLSDTVWQEQLNKSSSRAGRQTTGRRDTRCRPVAGTCFLPLITTNSKVKYGKNRLLRLPSKSRRMFRWFPKSYFRWAWGSTYGLKFSQELTYRTYGVLKTKLFCDRCKKINCM